MGKKGLVRAGVAAGAVLLLALGVWAVIPTAAVEGDGPAERVASVIRIADEQPIGAAGVLADVAANAREHPTVRQAALVALTQFPRKESRPIVEAALRDPLPDIRAAAANALGAYGDVAACEQLANVVLNSPDPDAAARIGAIQGLSRCPDPVSLAWLVRVVERESDPAVNRRALMETYARLGFHYTWPETRFLTEPERLEAIERFKGQILVQEAYRKAGWPLDRHPEHESTHTHKGK